MTINDLYNPLVKWLLRSPLHGVMSGSTLLLAFTGRKSGKAYSTPISYGREGETVWLITNPKYTWWKNFQTPAPVTLWIANVERRGTAQVQKVSPAEMAQKIQLVYRGIPAQQAEAMAGNIVLVRIDLN